MISAYRLALQLLPAELRRKHGPAMETLFARELEHARAHGRPKFVLAAVTGVWDVIRRAAYELLRPERIATSGHNDSRVRALPTTRELLRRHAVSFTIAFVGLTSLLLLQYASRNGPALSAKGASPDTIANAVLLALPFTAAMTIPMAVFVAVIYEFTRFGADGSLAAARRVRDGVRRLVVPVLAASAVIAVLAFVVTAEIVPRANARLSVVLAGGATVRSDRSMTIGELREAARNVGSSTEAIALSRTAAYEVEIQKKFALPAACLVLALAGITLAFRIPRGGTWLVIGGSLVFFSSYYALLTTGEGLAERLVVSPFVAMWGANGVVLIVALLAVVRRRGPLAPNEHRPMPVRN